MSDVALFAGDRYYRSQFGTGLASYTVFQKDGVTYADPGYPGGVSYSGTEPGLVIRNVFAALNNLGGGEVVLRGPATYSCNSKITLPFGSSPGSDACVQ